MKLNIDAGVSMLRLQRRTTLDRSAGNMILAELKVSLPVSRLATWKTTFQLVSLGALILGGAIPAEHWIHLVGVTALWAAAALTLVTGWDYLRVGLRHMD